MIFAGKMRVGEKEDFSGVLLEGGEYINRVKLNFNNNDKRIKLYIF